MKILIVPDKFKGSLSSHEAAKALAAGWARIRPMDALDLLPMADGGEGFGEVFGKLLDARKQSSVSVDFSGAQICCDWWHNPVTNTAVFETAGVIGLGAKSTRDQHPFHMDTFGLGQVLGDIAGKGVRKLYIGLGGSATNDGGFGLARSLGWKFWGPDRIEIQHWTDLDRLEQVSPPPDNLPGGIRIPELIIVVDVLNPLLGPEGATRIYGPQKGILETEIEKAEACLARLALVLKAYSGEDVSVQSGAGAAGGLGFGLKTFYGGTIQLGAHVFSDLAQIRSRIQAHDYILTGEGSLDIQSLMGKGVGFIASLASFYKKPCLCFSGVNTLAPATIPWEKFRAYAICPDFASKEDSLVNAGTFLEALAAKAAMDGLTL